MTRHIIIIETDMDPKVLHEALCLALCEGNTELFETDHPVEDVHVVGQFNIDPETGAMTK